MGLSTSEKQQKYKFVVQQGNYNKLHHWRDVAEFESSKQAHRELAKRRQADGDRPYRCCRYLIFDLIENAVKEVMASSAKTNKELNDLSRLDHKKLDEPKTD